MAEHRLHPSAPADAEKAILDVILARRMRASVLAPDLFSDPAWDLLLILFLARLRRQRMTTGQLTRETGVSPRTADRWLDALDRHGLLRRRPDPAGDMRNALVELSPGGASAMQQWLEAWIKSQSNAGSDNRVIDLLTRLQQDNE